jgi:hypothetical protein
MSANSSSFSFLLFPGAGKPGEQGNFFPPLDDGRWVNLASLFGFCAVRFWICFGI